MEAVVIRLYSREGAPRHPGKYYREIPRAATRMMVLLFFQRSIN
jgi:hypothetical protein